MPALNFDVLNKNMCRTIIGNELNFQRTISYIKKIILTMIIHAKDKDQKINDECKKVILLIIELDELKLNYNKFNKLNIFGSLFTFINDNKCEKSKNSRV